MPSYEVHLMKVISTIHEGKYRMKNIKHNVKFGAESVFDVESTFVPTDHELELSQTLIWRVELDGVNQLTQAIAKTWIIGLWLTVYQLSLS